MSAKKYRLETVSTTRENGYDWAVVECPECGEEVQQRQIEDEGQAWMDDYREDVCPACDQSIQFDTSNKIAIPKVKSQSTQDWEEENA